MSYIKKMLMILFFSFLSMSFVMSANNDLSMIYKQLGLSEDLSYTATMHTSLNPAQKSAAMKMYYKNGDIRTEGQQSGMDFVMILKKDGTMYSYNKAMNIWVKMTMKDMLKEGNIPEYKKIGAEEIDGKECIRFEAVDPQTRFKTIVWVHDGYIFRNSTESPDGVQNIVYYGNIEKKELDDSLFNPPEGAPVQDMTDMMKQIAAGGQ